VQLCMYIHVYLCVRILLVCVRVCVLTYNMSFVFDTVYCARGGGGHLHSKWVRMCVNKIEHKGLFFNRDRVTRVTRLGYGIRPKMAKMGCFFLSNLEKGTFPKF
jgi:hypothetical protein